MRTIESYEDFRQFVLELNTKYIFCAMGIGEKPTEDYWSEIPLQEQTFNRLYEGLEKSLKKSGIAIVLPEGKNQESIKETLVVATLPVENVRNTVKLMIHDEAYMNSIKGQIGRIIYLTGFLVLDNQEEEALALLELAEECELSTILANDTIDVGFAHVGCLRLTAELIQTFQAELEKDGINISIIDEFETINSKEEFEESTIYSKLLELNSKRAEVVKRLIFLANKISSIL